MLLQIDFSFKAFVMGNDINKNFLRKTYGFLRYHRQVITFV